MGLWPGLDSVYPFTLAAVFSMSLSFPICGCVLTVCIGRGGPGLGLFALKQESGAPKTLVYSGK